ncbi:probable E3 SUMO-protein ligase RNF212 isoform X2 [Oryctolagus cuniculus]|uniref:probable E3 SUMO-protein ligase RNF212 isoform X2 n=1 Tax=Oryctolagus cuniculus TaxID=9986 RepID=UPI0038791366
MAGWVFCNRCFQPPRSKARFSLTNCGHVYCDGCLGRAICVLFQTDAEIQAFFVGIDSLCRKYSQETSQISEFQEKHRRRLLAFYGEKISKLEESLRKLVLQIEQLQSVRSSQQTAFGTVRTSVPPAPARPRGCLLLPTGSSAPDRVESMEVDLTPSPVRRPQPEVAAGPTRMSLISPPQDGRMGSHRCRSPTRDPHRPQQPRQRAEQREEAPLASVAPRRQRPGRPSASPACCIGRAQGLLTTGESHREDEPQQVYPGWFLPPGATKSCDRIVTSRVTWGSTNVICLKLLFLLPYNECPHVAGAVACSTCIPVGAGSSPGCSSSNPALCCGLGKR